MILLAILVAFVMIERWQVRHIHTTYARPYQGVVRVGDIVYHRGIRSVVIFMTPVDMVIRRELSGLFLPWRRKRARMN